MRSDYVDWEAELVVVIGKDGKNISKENAWEHVAGMCVGQDISDRPAQFATTPAMFNLGKSFDTYGPMGPCLVSLDSLEDYKSLDIECRLNGETVQKDNTNDLIFDVPSIISYLSEIVTLKVGDAIWTGTPSGVGIASGKFLKDGDELTTTIEGLGTMENKCVRISDHSRAKVVPEFMKGFLKD
jgi:2-keto-4-pentenoate hydratase/2-oxohepta-3-ene-1,7-dioic acid hydratase in catechol pathway